MKIINFKERKLLKNEPQNSYQNSKICYIFKVFVNKNLKINIIEIKRGCKMDHFHYTRKYSGAAYST